MNKREYVPCGDGELEDEKEDYKLALEAFEEMKNYKIK